jgi:hypothetical protein
MNIFNPAGLVGALLFLIFWMLLLIYLEIRKYTKHL